MKIHLSTDFLTGLLFSGLGATAIIIGAKYPLGTAARMGAGYFPLLVSVGLIILGGILLVRSFVSETEEVGEIDLRPFLVMLASVLLFGLLIEDWGFPLAGAVVVVGASLAGRVFKPIETSLLAVGLVVFCTLLFSYGLGLNLPHTRFW
ncbi:MAG TPA: tripartite tricarboxylate transporter TctB family protein [Ancylobacter sp.]